MLFNPTSESDFDSPSLSLSAIRDWAVSVSSGHAREAYRAGWPDKKTAVRVAKKLFLLIADEEFYQSSFESQKEFEQAVLADIRKAKHEPEDTPAATAPSAESVAASWANPEVHSARTTRNHVIVKYEGKEETFRSVRVAFEELNLPMEKHIKFRTKMKKAGSMPFVWAGVEYLFEVKQR